MVSPHCCTYFSHPTLLAFIKGFYLPGRRAPSLSISCPGLSSSEPPPPGSPQGISSSVSMHSGEHLSPSLQAPGCLTQHHTYSFRRGSFGCEGVLKFSVPSPSGAGNSLNGGRAAMGECALQGRSSYTIYWDQGQIPIHGPLLQN